MAFDQSTRNRLQRFVNEARTLLTEEFTRQLQKDYGLDPKTGEVAEIAKLSDLDDSRLETARILRQVFAHYLATEAAGGRTAEAQVLERIVREQAFTVLNRLAALRMAEARGILFESVGNGYQAKGFQLYARLAGTGLGETGDVYRGYLFSVFDEQAQDLPSLFDRYSPQGRLFPRETALLPLLALINDPAIEALWAEDETIGWIYQYFNSKEERKAMRDASQAPRNSRELAVRNQFFTPRYVVEFLLDNTLGRLWFNATGGQTALRERCQYLLVKPDEAPPAATKLRDPRTLKLLDPACGSMHFGLYAFDLFLEIYRESWAWEQQHGPGSLSFPAPPAGDGLGAKGQAFKPLCHTYADEAAFLRDVPRLIIEHNIYGVDIDPRAAQIASLALWLRAQRAWHEAGVKAKDRPLIGRGHVVAATAPPAERELRQQFAAGLDQRDAELFEKTLQLLKGLPELGVLLRVERELPALIRQVYVGRGTGLFAEQERENWQQAEARLHEALTEFAQAARSTYQGRLFAQDALQGLRLIDLCREVFDVVVMNPPFGLVPENSFAYFQDRYPDTYVDVYGCFVERGWELLRHGGYVGAITSRTFIGSKKLIRWRENLIKRLVLVSDLGNGVMDDALVMSAAYIVVKDEDCQGSINFGDFRREIDKERALLNLVSSSAFKAVDRNFFHDLPGIKLLYGAPKKIADIFKATVQLEPTIGTVRKGLTTFDDFRYLRLRWEVENKSIGRNCSWELFAKGGEYSVYYTDVHLVVKRENNGAELAETNRLVNGQVAQSRQASSFYYLPGSQFTSRSASGFSARAIPAGCTWSSNAPMILSQSDTKPSYILGWVNSRLIRTLIEMQSTADDYVPNSLKCLPWISASILEKDVSNATDWLVGAYRRLEEWGETDPFFLTPFNAGGSRKVVFEFGHEDRNELLLKIRDTQKHISTLIDRAYDFDSSELSAEVLERDVTEECPSSSIDLDTWKRAILSYCVGVALGRFDWRLATREREPPPEPGPFDPLPAKSPGMLPDGAKPFHVHPGILVDDSGHPHDLVHLIEEVLARVNIPATDDVRRWLQRDFFPFHLQRYSKSRRKAPIYWPLATASGSYTLWVYYPSLGSQTLYTAINDFVEPKLQQVAGDLSALRTKGSARTRDDERRFEALQGFELELIELRDTLLRIAPTYMPNQDDGVQISAAPLWSLFRHKPWQKVLKDTWAKLEKGDYDWAHLALNYWPERVREKCKSDKSLAIAHGLEDLYVEPEAQQKKPRGRRKAGI